MSMTITEALAEVKTAQARIEKKRQQISLFLGRDSRLRDPHEKDGGSREFVARERQAVKDLEERIVRIRAAIQTANLNTYIEVEGERRTVTEWLAWRRDVAGNAQKFLGHMSAQIQNLRRQASSMGQQVRNAPPDAPATQGDLVVNIEEGVLASEIDKMEKMLGALDGRLSLVNATTYIAV